MGIESEIPLMIHRLLSLPDESGKQVPISVLKSNGYIHPDVEPVLYIRASRTNYRIFDPILMNERKQFHRNLRPFFKYILEN